MNAQAPQQSTWQSIGDLAAALVQEKTRQRANAPGDDRQQRRNGDAQRDTADEGDFQ